MKNHKLLSGLLMLLMGGVFFMTSCEDDDEDTLGLIGSWKVTGAIFNPAIDTNGAAAGGTVTDAYPMLFAQACDQDDLFIFEDGGVLYNDEGATKCDSLSNQQDTSTYIYSGSTITLYTGDTIIFTNTVITNSTLTGKVTVDLGTIANIDVTMTRQ